MIFMQTRFRKFPLTWSLRRRPHLTAGLFLLGICVILILILNFISNVLRNGTGQIPNDSPIQIHDFVNPSVKNNLDLVKYAEFALDHKWGYLYGTYGQVLNQPLLDSRRQTYPDEVVPYLDFIHKNWLGGHVTDCAGLIKGYGWLDPSTGIFQYAANHIPDLCADDMYRAATEKGGMDSMPETPGLAVWMDGHIGIYAGHGTVIEAMTTTRGVVKTELKGRGWLAWIKIPEITYY